MPSLSTSETAIRPAEPAATQDQPLEGASAIVEAATAQDAIAEVHAAYGAGARIVEARRVLRGGIGGFFAKEHVQLHVAAPSAAPHPWPVADVPSADTPVADRDDIAARAVALAAELTAGLEECSTSPTSGGPGVSPVDRLLGQGAASDPAPSGCAPGRPAPSEAGEHLDFGTYLRQQLAAERAAILPEPTEPVTTTPDPGSVDGEPGTPHVPAADVAAIPAGALRWVAPASPVAEADRSSLLPVDETVVDTGPAWSTTRLLHLGLPATLVHGLQVAAPADDLAWLRAVTDAVRPLCRPLPAGEAVLVGPGAPALAEEIGTPAARSRTWLTALGSGRWRHLVLGGERWREELTTEPLAVSWTRPQELPDALRCAIELGLVLGYGPQGGTVRRARPLDVALAVRALVDDR